MDEAVSIRASSILDALEELAAKCASTDPSHAARVHGSRAPPHAVEPLGDQIAHAAQPVRRGVDGDAEPVSDLDDAQAWRRSDGSGRFALWRQRALGAFFIGLGLRLALQQRG